MVSHHFVSQLVLFAFLWLFIILHLLQPKRPVAASEACMVKKCNRITSQAVTHPL